MIKVSDFAHELCKRYGLSPDDASAFINDMFEVMKEELTATDSSVKIKSFGTFKVSAVGARASVDVNTGERIIIDGRNKITFTPEVLLRDRVNRPFVQFETVVLNDGVDFSEIDDEEASDDDGVESVDNDKTEPTIVEEPQEEAIDESEEKAEDKNEQESEAIEGTNSFTENVTQESNQSTDDAEQSTDVVEQDAEQLPVDNPQESEQSSDDGNQDSESKGCLCAETDTELDTETNSESNENPTRAMARQLMSKTRASSDDNVDDDDVDDDNDEYDGIVCKQRNPRLMYVLTIASFLLLIILGIGMYFLYVRIEEKNNVIGNLENRLYAQVDSTYSADSMRQVEKAKAVPDTTSIATDNASFAEEKADKQSNAKDTISVPATSSTSPSDYNYDVRVRTGAYIIVGVAQTVTVKPGQTLASISKTYLGEGMECYVEVLNNCKQVKAGDKLKIPQLKLKPRRR